MSCSKARWYKEGEKNTKYFYRLEKQHYNNKTITCIILSDGSISRNQKKILHEQARFYKKLYSSDTEINFTFIKESQVKLSEDEKLDIDRLITLEELTVSLKSLRSGQTVG